MRFELSPMRIRKDAGFEKGVLNQSLSFTAAIKTADDHYERSSLTDGRKIDSLSCFVSVEITDTDKFSGVFVFQPAYISMERGVSSTPDQLSMEVCLPAELFRELWAVVENDVRIIFFGTVAGMTSATSHALAPYKWDISDDQNRVKDLKSFKFVTFTLLAPDASLMLNMECIPDTAGGDAVRENVEERHSLYGQMRLLCLKVIDQAVAEAVRLGSSQPRAQRMAEEAVALIDDAHAAVRSYAGDVKEVDPTRLWVHQKLGETFAGGRSALGPWDVRQDKLTEITRELMDRPWLRIDRFEWAIVDALIFREVFEFGETVKAGSGSFVSGWAYAKANGRLRRIPWEKFKAGAVLWALRWGMVAAGMWVTWAYVTNGEYSDWPSIRTLSGTFAVLFWFFIGLPVGRKAVRRQRQLHATILQKMNDAYATLRQDELLSPHQIRAALLAAQDCGAIWDAAAFALLDRAAQRNPPIWAL